VGSPGTVSALCPACYLEAENLLDEVMRGQTPLHSVPGALSAWWLAGDNNAEGRDDLWDSYLRQFPSGQVGK
jgi:hypothetical protein